MIPEKVEAEYTQIEELLAEHNADAYIHIGNKFDEFLFHLTRFNGPDRDYAFVYKDHAILCAPEHFEEQAKREFIGTEVQTLPGNTRETPAQRALSIINTKPCANRVVVPESNPHRLTQDIEDEVESLCTVNPLDIRRTKTRADVDQLQKISEITQSAMDRAESILASSEVRDDRLHWDGSVLTTERLRRSVNGLLGQAGASPVRNTVIGVGPTCADLHHNGNAVIRPNQTILIDIAPRSSEGFYGDMTRTFVRGTVPNWEQTAYDTVQTALDAGLDALEDGAGTSTARVREAVISQIEANGFDTGAVRVGMNHGVGHGVGTSLHEPPFLSSDTELVPGDVITIEPGIYHPTRGGVRLEDEVQITEDGYKNLVQYPREIHPQVRRAVRE